VDFSFSGREELFASADSPLGWVFSFLCTFSFFSRHKDFSPARIFFRSPPAPSIVRHPFSFEKLVGLFFLQRPGAPFLLSTFPGVLHFSPKLGFFSGHGGILPFFPPIEIRTLLVASCHCLLPSSPLFSENFFFPYLKTNDWVILFYCDMDLVYLFPPPFDRVFPFYLQEVLPFSRSARSNLSFPIERSSRAFFARLAKRSVLCVGWILQSLHECLPSPSLSSLFLLVQMRFLKSPRAFLVNNPGSLLKTPPVPLL